MAEKRFGGVITEWDDYLKLFRNVKKETAIGEASVCYLWSKTAAQNIQAKIPNAKIIMILRDPVDRAFSQYLQSLTGGRTRNSFRSYVETCLSRRNGQLDEFRFCLEFGEYSDAIQRYLDQFPRENIHIVFYEDYQEQQSQVLAATFRFLGVDPTFTPDTRERQLRPRVPRSLALGYFLKKWGLWQYVDGDKLRLPSVHSCIDLRYDREKTWPWASRDRELLLGYYQNDIRKLERLLDRDLTAWLR